MHIYYTSSKNKKSFNEIFNYLKKKYPNKTICLHYSSFFGTRIFVINSNEEKEIIVQQNKFPNKCQKIDLIHKNSLIFNMNNIDDDLIKNFNLKKIN